MVLRVVALLVCGLLAFDGRALAEGASGSLSGAKTDCKNYARNVQKFCAAGAGKAVTPPATADVRRVCKRAREEGLAMCRDDFRHLVWPVGYDRCNTLAWAPMMNVLNACREELGDGKCGNWPEQTGQAALVACRRAGVRVPPRRECEQFGGRTLAACSDGAAVRSRGHSASEAVSDDTILTVCKGARDRSVAICSNGYSDVDVLENGTPCQRLAGVAAGAVAGTCRSARGQGVPERTCDLWARGTFMEYEDACETRSPKRR